MKTANRIVTVVAVVVILTCGAAEATSLALLSLEELTAAAEAVVHARCVANQSKWERGEIWTFTQFEVLDVLKGRAPAQITVRLIGGRVGHVSSIVSLAPRFRPSEEVILFLEHTGAAEFSITAWSAGTFRVRRDLKSGAQLVSQDTCGQPVFDHLTRQFRAAGLCHVSLAVLQERIEAGARETGANPR